MKNRKIAVMTGTRAEYGLLKPLLFRFKESKKIELLLFVTGSHLSQEFGYTLKEIEKDGFSVTKKIEILLSGDSAVSLSKAIGLGFIGFSEAFAELNPDLSVVLGDRFEALAFAVSSVIAKIPVAHIHGGETTYGAIDEPIRHAITKFSSLHFASTKVYQRRIIQMGEDPNSVFNVGALGVENCLNLKFISKIELEKLLDLKFKETVFLITYHPETLSKTSVEHDFNELLKALESYSNVTKIFTYANADSGGYLINNLIDDWVKKHSNAYVYPSLGQLKYLSVMKVASLVIGNSSSGIIEAPTLGVPTINIGQRQAGRIRAETIIDVTEVSMQAISKSINLGLGITKKACLQTQNPYGDGSASEKIFEIILNKNLISPFKKFFDIPTDLFCR